MNIFGAELVVVGGGFGTAAAAFLFEPALEVARREALCAGPRGSPHRAGRAGLRRRAVGAGLLAFEALDEAA